MIVGVFLEQRRDFRFDPRSRALFQTAEHTVHRLIQIGPKFSDKRLIALQGARAGPRGLLPRETALFVFFPAAAGAGIIAA